MPTTVWKAPSKWPEDKGRMLALDSLNAVLATGLAACRRKNNGTQICRISTDFSMIWPEHLCPNKKKMDLSDSLLVGFAVTLVSG